jgi:hypothetical protein
MDGLKFLLYRYHIPIAQPIADNPKGRSSKTGTKKLVAWSI